MLAAVNVSPARAPRVHHLAVLVRDLSRAEAFYGGVLGLLVKARHEDEAGPRSVWLALEGESFLALERAGSGAASRGDAQPGWHCVALSIEPGEREAWRERLRRGGHPVERESPYTLYVRDPDGTLVALSHHPVAAAVEEPKEAGITQRLAALVTLSLVLLGLATLPFARPLEAQRRARAPRVPDDVVLIGSSSVNGALGRLIETELEGSGLRVARHGRSSTGLARPDFFDWEAEVRELGDLASMRGVVVYMGGNDTQAIRLRRAEEDTIGAGEEWIAWRDEARWNEIYSSRVHALVEALCSAGAARVMWVLPTDGDREGWAERIHRVQDAQAAGTRGTTCGVVVDPRGLRITERSTSDGVHLTRTGAREVWQIIGPPLVAGLGSVALPALAESAVAEATAEDPATVPGG
jgi:glyoxylase I family protein